MIKCKKKITGKGTERKGKQKKRKRNFFKTRMRSKIRLSFFGSSRTLEEILCIPY